MDGRSICVLVGDIRLTPTGVWKVAAIHYHHHRLLTLAMFRPYMHLRLLSYSSSLCYCSTSPSLIHNPSSTSSSSSFKIHARARVRVGGGKRGRRRRWRDENTRSHGLLELMSPESLRLFFYSIIRSCFHNTLFATRCREREREREDPSSFLCVCLFASLCSSGSNLSLWAQLL